MTIIAPTATSTSMEGMVPSYRVNGESDRVEVPTMKINIDNALLALAAASYAPKEEPAPLVAVKRDPSTGRVTRKVATATATVKVAPAASAPVARITAEAFIAAIKEANAIRPADTTSESLAEANRARLAAESAAVAGFTGKYVPHESHSRQVNDARTAAASQISAAKRGPYMGPSRAEQRAINRSLSGYVAGMPDADKRDRLDAIARERGGAEAYCEATRKIDGEIAADKIAALVAGDREALANAEAREALATAEAFIAEARVAQAREALRRR